MRMLLAALGAALLLAAPTLLPPAAADRASRRPGNPVWTAESQPHGQPADNPDSGARLIGQPAPAWRFTRWIGAPHSLADLRGKVVLVRWWTEGCHYCAATLPELEALRLAHADEGLVVIGAFHPKPPREVSDRHVVALAKKLGFSGPIAVDRDWSTLNRYWLDGDPARSWTSVSFLIDRDGVIRWVHGGGEYHRSDDPAHARCAAQYRRLEQVLAGALAAKSGR